MDPYIAVGIYVRGLYWLFVMANKYQSCMKKELKHKSMKKAAKICSVRARKGKNVRKGRK